MSPVRSDYGLAEAHQRARAARDASCIGRESNKALTRACQVSCTTLTCQRQEPCCSLDARARKIAPLGRQKQALQRQQHRRTRHEDAIDLEVSIPILSGLSTEKLLHNELLCVFVRNYGQGWPTAHSQFLVNLTMDMIPPLLQTIIKALGIAHIALSRNDKQLFPLSRIFYSNTLHALTRILGRPANQLPKGSAPAVLVAIMLVGLYEEAEMQVDESRSCRRICCSPHCAGAQRLVKACGPQAFNLTDSHQVEMLHSIWTAGWAFGILEDQPAHLDLETWHEFGMSKAFEGSPLSGWHEIVLPMPDVISSLDKLLKKPKHQSGKTLSHTLAELLELRTKLQDWLSDAMASIDIVGNTDESAFDTDIEEHFFMSSVNTFIDQHFLFRHVQTGIFCVTSMMMLLICDCAILRVLHARSCDDKKLMATHEAQSFTSAINICRSIHFMSQLQDAGYRELECDALMLCERFFTDFGATEATGWCAACIATMQARFTRLREESQVVPSVCPRHANAIERLGSFLASPRMEISVGGHT